MKYIITLLILMMGVSLVAQENAIKNCSKTSEEKAFNKEHKILIKEYISENKSIKKYYKCNKIKNSKKQLQCYSNQEKEIIKNLKWFDKKEKKLIKKYGDGVSVFIYKY